MMVVAEVYIMVEDEVDTQGAIIALPVLPQVEATQGHLHIKVPLLQFNVKSIKTLIMLPKIAGIVMMMTSLL
jgi:hypothetical protein